MGTKVFGTSAEEPTDLIVAFVFSSFSAQGVLMVHDQFRSVMQYSNIRDGSGRDRISNDWFCVKVRACKATHVPQNMRKMLCVWFVGPVRRFQLQASRHLLQVLRIARGEREGRRGPR